MWSSVVQIKLCGYGESMCRTRLLDLTVCQALENLFTGREKRDTCHREGREPPRGTWPNVLVFKKKNSTQSSRWPRKEGWRCASSPLCPRVARRVAARAPPTPRESNVPACRLTQYHRRYLEALVVSIMITRSHVLHQIQTTNAEWQSTDDTASRSLQRALFNIVGAPTPRYYGAKCT